MHPRHNKGPSLTLLKNLRQAGTSPSAARTQGHTPRTQLSEARGLLAAQGHKTAPQQAHTLPWRRTIGIPLQLVEQGSRLRPVWGLAQAKQLLLLLLLLLPPMLYVLLPLLLLLLVLLLWLPLPLMLLLMQLLRSWSSSRHSSGSPQNRRQRRVAFTSCAPVPATAAFDAAAGACAALPHLHTACRRSSWADALHRARAAGACACADPHRPVRVHTHPRLRTQRGTSGCSGFLRLTRFLHAAEVVGALSMRAWRGLQAKSLGLQDGGVSRDTATQPPLSLAARGCRGNCREAGLLLP